MSVYVRLDLYLKVSTVVGSYHRIHTTPYQYRRTIDLFCASGNIDLNYLKSN